jgi:ElaA protein
VKVESRSPEFVCGNFDDFDRRLFYVALRLRSEIFVVEQNCVYLDLDRKDYDAVHLVAVEGPEVTAVCRWFHGDEGLALGRIVVRPDRRGSGLGKLLVAEALRRIGRGRVVMHAQAHLERFYAAFGFKQEGLPFLEDGIPHLFMARNA